MSYPNDATRPVLGKEVRYDSITYGRDGGSREAPSPSELNPSVPVPSTPAPSHPEPNPPAPESEIGPGHHQEEERAHSLRALGTPLSYLSRIVLVFMYAFAFFPTSIYYFILGLMGDYPQD